MRLVSGAGLFFIASDFEFFRYSDSRIYGILHLCGFDHETDDGEMNAKEIELREVLKIAETRTK